MLSVLISTLKNGLEVAFLLAVIGAYIAGTGRRQLLGPLKWGVLVALAATPGLAYGVESFLEREVVEGALNLMAVPLTLSLMLWMGWARNRPQDGLQGGHGVKGRAISVLVFTASLVLVSVRGLDIALVLIRVLAQATGLLSTELATQLGAGLVGLSLAAGVGVTLRKVVGQVKATRVALVAALSLSILLLREATTAVHMLIVLGVVPLTDWLFQLLVPLVNNYQAFYYALFAAACILVLIAYWEHRHKRYRLNELNPAQRRKLRSTSRRTASLMGAVGALLLLVSLADAANAFYANRPLQLSPATPLSSQDNKVMIPIDSVSDGRLYRFSYQAAAGTTIRFLVIHKGSGVFGVGLDACEFCGVAGYRQDGETVVCNRCGAAINIATIGFPGGCNPLPLAFSKEGSFLVIEVEALEKVTGVFQ